MVKLSRKWKDRATGVGMLDAEACEREINRLAKSGTLTPEVLVAHARDADSALHDGFTWDDSDAAEKYRLQEASYILRALVYIEDPGGAEEREVRCFVNVRGEDEPSHGVYVPIKDAMSDPRHRSYVLDVALRDASAYANKYRDFEELARIVRAIDATVKQHEREHATA